MEILLSYWSRPELLSNGLIILNILGAGGLGMLLGYERAYHGHAAGMRTYSLVAMAAAGLTVICGYPALWYGGGANLHGEIQVVPTQVIQGIVTGIGFLGAGVIMKDGFSIRGLSTAASIWATSAVGILTGVGFYAASILITLLILLLMGNFKRLEMALPHRRHIRLAMTFHRHKAPTSENVASLMKDHGFEVMEMSCQSQNDGKHFVYDLVLQGDGGHSFNNLVDSLGKFDSLAEFSLSPVRE